MPTASIGWYDERNKAAVWIDKGAIRSSFIRDIERVRVESLENMVVLTQLERPAFTHDPETYLEE
jgi:hypothetical protein